MMKAILACLCMCLATPNDRGFVTAADLHAAMDRALANGWQPQKETAPELTLNIQKQSYLP
jgi:hypothetical protein